MKAPDVLVALCGLTPQVVTETLWALGHRKPAIVPGEIWVLTTLFGEDACQRTLMGKRGALTAYYREYFPNQRPPHFQKENLVVLRRTDGNPLDDLRSEHDNRAAANQIADFIRRQTARPEVRLHCSVAGGRKTMGIFLAGALQLYGRPEDRLYHVLVSPEFETHPEFFYKPKRPRILRSGKGKHLNTKDAVIELAEIPYVRLRDTLSPEALTGKKTFTELVTQAQHELQQLTAPELLTIDPTTGRMQIGEHPVYLPPTAFKVFAALARIKTRHCTEPQRPRCGECTACYPILSKETWEKEAARLGDLGFAPFPGSAEPAPTALPKFRSLVSKVNRTLEETLGSKRLAQRYGIHAVGPRSAKAYGLAADKGAIQETALKIPG